MANLSKLSVARWAKWPSTISNICSTIDEADEVEVLHCNIECAEFSVQWYAQPSCISASCANLRATEKLCGSMCKRYIDLTNVFSVD